MSFFKSFGMTRRSFVFTAPALSAVPTVAYAQPAS